MLLLTMQELLPLIPRFMKLMRNHGIALLTSILTGNFTASNTNCNSF